MRSTFELNFSGPLPISFFSVLLIPHLLLKLLRVRALLAPQAILYKVCMPVLEIEIEIAFAKIDLHPDCLDRRSRKFGVDLDL